MIYCIPQSASSLYQAMKSKSSNSAEEKLFTLNYDNLRKDEALLLVQDESFGELLDIFRGSFTEDPAKYKSILEYAFIQLIPQLNPLEVYLFSHIKQNLIDSHDKFLQDPFFVPTLNYDIFVKDMNLQNASAEEKYNFFTGLLKSVSQRVLNIQFLETKGATIHPLEQFEIKLIETPIIPTFDQFKVAIADRTINEILGFSFNLHLNDVVLNTIYDLDQIRQTVRAVKV